jgi:CRP-like cAMP-binding protein
MSLPPRQRLAARLLLSATPGACGEKVVRLSQQALGEMIGVTRKTVNAHLAALERQQLLTASYNHIVLRDPKGLQRIADS